MLIAIMVRDIDERGAVRRVAELLDICAETLRAWSRLAEVDEGSRSGTACEQAEENWRLRVEYAELWRVNEILEATSGFSARQLDRPRRR